MAFAFCPAPPADFTTTFPLTENPISEGGLWLQNDPLQTKVKTTGGNAYGTQDGTGAFDDSSAYLTGFGTDYEVEAIVAIVGGLTSGPFREIEILLRWIDNGPLRSTAFGDTHCNGYEVSRAWDGEYMHVGRFKGADLTTQLSGVGTAVAGDKFRARIEGQRIRVWWNDVIQFDVTDNDAVLKQTTGNPGIGFFIGVGATTTQFGFSSVIVRRL